jgi:cardiolipin synthase A/B
MYRIAALCLLFLLPWTATAQASPLTSNALNPRPASYSTYLPWLAKGTPPIMIAAAHIDSARSGEADEAIMLWNTGNRTEPLAGWQLESNGRRTILPATSSLSITPGQRLWLAAEALAFRQSFGEAPAAEWASNTDPLILDLEGPISLANAGGTLRLLDPNGAVVDVFLYGDETVPAEGWTGPPSQLYTRGVVTAQGQVWQRKRDPQTGVPVDANRAQDWAGDLTDPDWGRQVRWPGWLGWDTAGGALPSRGDAVADILLAIGPEGIYAPVAQALDAATTSIDLAIYTLEHPQLAHLLAAAAGRGVKVRVLLDGAPPGGITRLQKWCVAQLVASGGDVRYFAVVEDAPNGLKRRYRYMHAKYGIVDAGAALVLTENFSRDSMPLPAQDSLGGRRGFALLTNAPPVVAALQNLFAADWAPERFLDLRTYNPADPKYGAPPADYTPPDPPEYDVADAPFGEPLLVRGSTHFTVVTAPENALRPDAGLPALIHQAGPGDELALMQLYEHRHWGPATSSPLADPNPRLESLIAAARRGAKVRILLDSFFDDPDDLRNNAGTVAYVRALAAAEGLDLQARVGNPTAGGIHAKLLLAHIGSETWSAVGSLNGGEVSFKLNRELVLLMDTPAVYNRLLAVFLHDWALARTHTPQASICRRTVCTPVAPLGWGMLASITCKSPLPSVQRTAKVWNPVAKGQS